MLKFGGAPVIYDVDPYTDSVYQMHPLGALAVTDDGRKFRYVKAVAATVAGKCYGSAGQDSQFQSMTPTAPAAIGATSVSVTNGTTTVAANDFNEGYLVTSYSTGYGQTAKILSHSTGASGATITYNLDRPLETALTVAASKVTVIKNPFDDVIVQATTPVAPAVGIAPCVIATGYYGWIQTGGPIGALWDASVAAVDTLGVSPSTTTAGCVTVSSTGYMVMGYSMQVVPVSAYMGPVFLTLD
jgi:hypothetical protein